MLDAASVFNTVHLKFSIVYQEVMYYLQLHCVNHVHHLQLLLTMMDLESPDKSKRTITHEGHLNEEEEATGVTANKEAEQKQVKEVVGKLLTPCVLTLRTSLQDKRFV